MPASIRRHFCFLTAVAFFLIGNAISAKADDSTLEWLKDVPCDLQKQAAAGFENGKYYLICFKYNELELRPTSDDSVPLDLTLVIYTGKGGTYPKITSFDLETDWLQRGVEIEQRWTEPPQAQTTLPNSIFWEHPYRIKLSRNSRPGRYGLKLVLELDRRLEVYYRLPVGAGPGDWLETTKESQRLVSCWTGNNCSDFKLHLMNKLPYRVDITSITITSEPAGLVNESAAVVARDSNCGPPESIESQAKPKVACIPAGLVPQDLDFKIQAIGNLWRSFEGFGKSPRLTFHINYQDELGRMYTTTPQVDLEIRPNIAILAITLIVGVLFGTVIRIDLRRLERAGLITRNQMIVFAATSIGSGVLVSLIALFANIKLVAFQDQSTYSSWDPKVLFVTGLIGTLGGIPLIYSMLKLPSPAPTAKAAESTSTTTK